MKPYGLSKSRILAFRQCAKRLWLSVHSPELAQESAFLQARFDVGHRVGEIARRSHPDGILVEHFQDPAEALEATAQAIGQYPERPLFEAAFEHDGVLVRADLMLPGRDGYKMVEVKSSASVKDYHITDCATQAWVIGRARVPLADMEVACIDSSFVYPGNNDYEGLLKTTSVRERAGALLDLVPEWVEAAQQTLSGPMPDIGIGDHCGIPFECPFHTHCSRGLPPPPDFPVTVLPGRRGKKLARELLEEGVSDLRDVAEDRLESVALERIRRVTVSGGYELDPRAGEELQWLAYPRYYLDFETIGFTIPIWMGTRPFQQFPFQWSCHVEAGDGGLRHLGFLDVTGEPPMRPFAESLLHALNEQGPIFVYNAGFEAGRIRDLMAMFPDLAPGLGALIGRIVDLLPIARKYYYHADMKGSWSIKDVLPTVAPELDYSNLEEVQEGEGAQRAYLELTEQEVTGDRKAALSEALKRYCERDTLGMVRLARFFQMQ